MLSFVRTLPADLVEGFHAGQELRISNAGASAPLFAVGMGGSAISADLARSLVEAETTSTLVVVRGSDLPGAASSGTTVVILSYSGETREALEAYDLAGRRGARRTVVTSGGTLADRASADEVPALRVPAGRPPRAAAGWILGSLLGMLDPWFPGSNEARCEKAAQQLRSAMPRLAAPAGPAARLADQLGRRWPTVLAERSLTPLARRWATQLEENAKQSAAFDDLPEGLHNAVEGWEATRPSEAARLALVALTWDGQPAGIARAFRHVGNVARRGRIPYLRARLAPVDRLAALLYGLALGDLVSLELARRRGVDPSTVPAIVRARAALARSR